MNICGCLSKFTIYLKNDRIIVIKSISRGGIGQGGKYRPGISRTTLVRLPSPGVLSSQGVPSSQVSPHHRYPIITGVPSSQVSSHHMALSSHHRCPLTTGVLSSHMSPRHRCQKLPNLIICQIVIFEKPPNIIAAKLSSFTV